jgi:hypothetical protein
MERNVNRTRLLGAAVALAAGVGITGAVAQCGPRRANPCAPKAANPCAPRAANPCAARNPCAAANPCAAKNPCAANPCAAKNPCAANPCAANPCAPAKAATLTTEQATRLYAQLEDAMARAYAKSGIDAAGAYQGWAKFNTAPYRSQTHGERYVNNYANETARDYGKFDGGLVLPEGSVLAKDSIGALPGGKAEPGPLFLMEKMPAGFNEESADWKYTIIGPDGTVIGETNGRGNGNVTFCAGCHQAAGPSQAFFLPEEFRVRR